MAEPRAQERVRGGCAFACALRPRAPEACPCCTMFWASAWGVWLQAVLFQLREAWETMDPAISKTQQFRSVREAVWACDLIGGSAKLVALRLVEYWPRIFPSLATIGQFTGLSERCIRDALRELERKKIITTHRQQGLSSSYQFIGVSIPALGKEEDDGDSGPGSSEREAAKSVFPPSEPPRRSAPGGGAPIAGPPRLELPPKPSRLSLLDKGRRDGALPSPPPAPPRGLWNDLDGWELSASLRAEAIAAGVPAHRLDARIKRLRNIRIGGKNGVRNRDEYVRACFEQWAKWEKENAAKEASRNGLRPRTGYWGSDGWEPSRGMRAYAYKWGLDLDGLARVFVESGKCEAAGNKEQADRSFIRQLVETARQQHGNDAVRSDRKSGAA